MKSAWILLFVTVAQLLTSALSQSCPNVCICTGNIVTCAVSGTTALPDGIPASVTSLTINTTSSVDQNHFGELVRGNISDFKQLSEITFSRCGITSIGSGTFLDLTQLKSLTVEFNKLDVIYPGTFMFASDAKLQTLTLSSNGIKTLRDFTFRGLTVDTLDLSGNEIETIQDLAFFESSVKTLDLSNNKIASLGNALKSLAGSLTALDMRRNGMKTLSADSLTSLTNLVTIDLSENMIREVTPAMLNKLTSLKGLNLNHNAMTGLREEFLAIIDRVDSINVDNNPFSCDCELKWLKTFAQPNQTCQQAKKCFTGVRCASPNDILLKDFPEEKFKCSEVKIASTKVKLSEVSCRATGSPAPSIWWIAPSGAVVQAARVTYGPSGTNSTIKITLDSEIGAYKCVAGNSLGNVSAVVKDVGTCRSRNVCYGPGDIAGAVLGTFCFVVILVALLWAFRHKIFKKKDGRKKPVPRFKNNVYRDITSPVGKTNRGETERM